MPTQHITTLLGATCCLRLATVLRHVGCCWLKFDQFQTLSPGQTIATCQRDISQHCWAHHVACVWPPCCDMLGVVGSNLKIANIEPTTSNMSQHIATRWPNARNMLRPTMLRYVGLACCDRLAGALANNTQHVATHRNTVAKRTQHVAPNNVATCCVGMLRSFGRGLTGQ